MIHATHKKVLLNFSNYVVLGNMKLTCHPPSAVKLCRGHGRATGPMRLYLSSVAPKTPDRGSNSSEDSSDLLTHRIETGSIPRPTGMVTIHPTSDHHVSESCHQRPLSDPSIVQPVGLSPSNLSSGVLYLHLSCSYA